MLRLEITFSHNAERLDKTLKTNKQKKTISSDGFSSSHIVSVYNLLRATEKKYTEARN